MSSELLLKLKQWRDSQAQREGKDPYLVLGNQTLLYLSVTKIKDEKELLTVRGIKEKKFKKYGTAIWKIISSSEISPAAEEIISFTDNQERIFSVSVFLDLVNIGLKTFSAKVQGEISGVNVRGGHYYFDLKDKNDGSVLSCFVWKNIYALFGLTLVDGLEVIIHGYPGVHKPNGRISFRVDSLELVGEGVLKKQYEDLKRNLEKEGFFSSERKRLIPLFPHKIGLITSRQGEAIHDFLNNLGRFGYQIKFLDSRVEGAQSVPGLLSAINHFKSEDIDLLVIIRGGGSLESLLSFNNEQLVRTIAKFPKPVITGIGHEQDVSLADLVADRSCSTPTAVARLINYSWEQAANRISLAEKEIFGRLEREILSRENQLANFSVSIRESFRSILLSFYQIASQLKGRKDHLSYLIKLIGPQIRQSSLGFLGKMKKIIQQESLRVNNFEQVIELGNPKRQLRLGYSLLFQDNQLIRDLSKISREQEITVQLQGGKIYSEIKKIERDDE